MRAWLLMSTILITACAAHQPSRVRAPTVEASDGTCIHDIVARLEKLRPEYPARKSEVFARIGLDSRSLAAGMVLLSDGVTEWEFRKYKQADGWWLVLARPVLRGLATHHPRWWDREWVSGVWFTDRDPHSEYVLLCIPFCSEIQQDPSRGD